MRRCIVSLLVLIPLFSHAQKNLAPNIKEPILRSHLAFLADDLLEGRGTGQRGGDLTVRYLETQAALIGLQPLTSDAAFPYRQALDLSGSLTLPDSRISFNVNQHTISPTLGSDILLSANNGRTSNQVDADMVFVGYGVKAPEEQWDDFKGMDLRGKLIVMMANDPQPTNSEPARFAGKAMTYYGRWTYKFEEALRQGAAGVLLLHTNESASYGWNVPQASFSHERFNLAGKGNALEGWWKEESAREFFRIAGFDLDDLKAKAEQRDFRPIPIPARVQAQVQSQIRTIRQYNVAGFVQGTDPILKKEAVIYSAHWDHLGKVEEEGKPAQIWNGAIDNASGTAALLAMAQEAVKHPTKRSQIFLWPAAEEQYLLGSLAYVQNPLWPLEQTIADLNLDSMNFVGKTRDIGIAGSERSSLHEVAKQVAGAMQMRIAPSVPDLGGAYYRADHFNFARNGVPAFNVGSAVFSGDGHFDYLHEAEKSALIMKEFKNDYHTPRDRYHPEWDLSGMQQQAQFTLELGYRLANAKQKPTWRAGDPYGNLARTKLQ
ncbi:M28 family peptidase [Undibacterium fentianense]|uniref:M28 family peptidase n=1 Tax=Undibacterium fentianense TaxID=2828728 RepID=A0A941IDK5_9BURK|nr:M28 family peptidase [Undibacterium fentianense]MBR7800073.1 M28 family peptidase [Undibacterium fentianense]